MPLAPASLHRTKPFRFTPATHPAQHPVILFSDDQPPASFRISNTDSPHVPAPPVTPVSADRFLGFGSSSAGIWTRCWGVLEALTPSALVTSAWGFGWSSAGVLALGSGALKALDHSVLVKRDAQVGVHCTPASDQRVEVQRWPGIGSAKRALGFCWAVAGGVRQARQSVLVKSFSGSCNAPMPSFCDPGARCVLNGWGVSHA